VLDAALVAGDQAAAHPAVVPEPDRPAQHQDVGIQHPLVDGGGHHLRRAQGFESYVRREHGSGWLAAP